MESLLNILQFFHLLETAPNIPVSVFIPMIAVIGCLAGLCFYFFVRFSIVKADNKYLRETNRLANASKRHSPEPGSLLKTYCDGGDLFGVYASMKGDTYELLIEKRCAGCSFSITTGNTFYPQDPEPSADAVTASHPRRRSSDRKSTQHTAKIVDSSEDSALQMQSSLTLSQSMAMSSSSSPVVTSQETCNTETESTTDYSSSDTSSVCSSD